MDRNEAGEQLAARLLDDPLIKQATGTELQVLSIPRGGVVVGAAVAQALHCPHEVVAVKKIGFPGQAELAIGAMAEEGTLVFNPDLVGWLEPEDDYLMQAVDRTKNQIDTYIQEFRQGRRLDIQAKLVILVDDGIATGETMKAAVVWARTQQPQHVLVAVPVCSPQAAKELEKLADKFVCLTIPEQFWAVGQFYWDFDQVSDTDVLSLMNYQAIQHEG